jgi:hypothetical protein
MGPDPVDFQTHVAVQCSYTANAICRPDARGFAGGVVAMTSRLGLLRGKERCEDEEERPWPMGLSR